MENKYFTPEITDIRVGYECQVLNNKNWDSIVINGINSDEDYIHTTNCSYYAAGMSSLRVPYLTKEQIKAEGWENIKDLDDGAFSAIKTIGGTIYKLTWTSDKSMQMWDTNFEHCVYFGYCPSINEFRTISKLLNIKNEKDNNS